MKVEVANCDLNPATRMGIRRPPFAFTEHGVAMLSSVLNSKSAIQMNILIIRVFVQIRELVASNKDLAARVEKLETGQRKHGSIIAVLAAEIDRAKTPTRAAHQAPHRLQD